MKPIPLITFFLFPFLLSAQAPNAAYVKALYKKYPTQKSDLCPACKLWVNPYYKAIADTQQYIPLLIYWIYTNMLTLTGDLCPAI